MYLRVCKSYRDKGPYSTMNFDGTFQSNHLREKVVWNVISTSNILFTTRIFLQDGNHLGLFVQRSKYCFFFSCSALLMTCPHPFNTIVMFERKTYNRMSKNVVEKIMALYLRNIPFW